MAEWDADLGLGFPPWYMAYIRLYDYLFSFMTVALLVRTLVSRTRSLHAYALVLSAVCLAAMQVRSCVRPWPTLTRALDLASAELSLGLCMLLLYRALLWRKDDAPSSQRLLALWRPYLLYSHGAWALTLWIVCTRHLYTIMFLVVCVQWGIYAVVLAEVQRLVPVRPSSDGKPSPGSQGALLARLPYVLSSQLHILSLVSVLCMQILFLVVHGYAEELRDFHTWIIVTSRTFSLVFLSLTLLPRFLSRFDVPPNWARAALSHDLPCNDLDST
ncbi:hypothetical protein MNAN1_001289 [Malassezia nana]|uniref:Uncharacterized protein n=1 Tax=Malassezia nana TaxID=180528 RepID=A0AAF0EIC2_9BASI|nr:hypothetical protein MNAN1_001289 [Malassezia nana]